MTKKPERSRRSPQEKKKLSYERDRVNVYGQNDKASRKGIPKRKTASNRSLRRATTELVRKIAQTEDEAPRFDAGLADATFEGLHPARRKHRDLPLAVTLDKRPATRRYGADRVRTSNIRESTRAVIEQVSAYERNLTPSRIEARVKATNRKVEGEE